MTSPAAAPPLQPAELLQATLQALYLLCVLSVVVLLCIPPLHEPLRAALRPLVLHHVRRGLKWVPFAQSFASPLLTGLFTLSGRSVGIPFYIVVEPQLGYLLVMLLGFSLYVGNGLKDLVSAPRPQGVEGWEAEGKAGGQPRLLVPGGGGAAAEETNVDALEYGFPSSHTMNSLCLNFFVLTHLRQRHALSGAAAPLASAAAALWVGWIGVSRIYLGLHTPIDILGGAIAGALTLGAFLAVAPQWEAWARGGLWPVVLQLLGVTVSLRLHPRPLAHTPSYEYTVTFCGVMWGVAAALAIAAPQDLEQPLPLVAGNAPRIAARCLLGFLLVFAGKEGSRWLLRQVLPPVYGACPVAVRRLWQPPMHSLHNPVERGGAAKPSREASRLCGIPLNAKGEAWDLEVTGRFFSYAAVGFSVVFVAPWTFGQLGV